jgi:signal transduction histidine kinase
MRLADFITANLEPILVEWEAFAREIWPGAPTDPATLRDHAAQMLHAAVADMRSGQSDEQQSDKSKGKGGDGPAQAHVTRASAAHAEGRLDSGFDLPTVIAEYRALRASVIRLWRESRPLADLNDLSDITRFNESIDQSLTESVVAYSRQVERDRMTAFEEQKQRGRELRELNDALLVSSARQHELTERAEHAALALRELNEGLEQRVQERTRQMAEYQQQLRSLVAELSSTEQRERHRVATELHDNLAQLLAVCKMRVSAIEASAQPGSTVAKEAGAVRSFLGEGIAYTRTLMTDLRPDVLNDSDLTAAVGWVAQGMRRHGLEVRVEDDGLPKPLDEEMLGLLFHCVRELLFNVVKHARTNEATVSIERPDGTVRVTVADSGVGFDPTKLAAVPSEEGGFGLFSIRERLSLLGGAMEVEGSPGRGTRIRLTVPSPSKRRGNRFSEPRNGKKA